METLTARERTEKYIVRKKVPIHLIDVNQDNPNEMSDAEFNMLADNFQRVGYIDPIFLRPTENERFRMIGGHHRLEIAKLEGFEDIDATINTDPDFDEDQERFQLLRMNTIRGKISPKKFLSMYQQMNDKYSEEILRESFGFADEEEFKKLIKTTQASLPKELQEDFKKASTELKTIDDLSKLLNRLFTQFGDTLEYGYMLMDFGGKDSIWLRMSNDTKKAVLDVGKTCQKEKRTVDSIIGGMIRLMAQGKLQDQLLQLIAQTPEVEIPEGNNLPTAESLAIQGI
jgi:hypothetical protein